MDKNITEEEAIEKFGQETVDLAVSFYETDFDKYFWDQLSYNEKIDYLNRAKIHNVIYKEDHHMQN